MSYEKERAVAAEYRRTWNEEIYVMTEKYPNAPACPFCGSRHLSDTDWWDDDGEIDAIECDGCKGSAPADVWCGRRACDALPDSVQEALNSGDGAYRP